jgi:hypothetical protein
MSNSSKWNQNIKIYGITKLKADVIFLSDIRLSNKNLVSAKNDVERIFATNPYASYTFYENSSMNKRGTGILIKKRFAGRDSGDHEGRRREHPGTPSGSLRNRSNTNKYLWAQ